MSLLIGVHTLAATGARYRGGDPNPGEDPVKDEEGVVPGAGCFRGSGALGIGYLRMSSFAVYGRRTHVAEQMAWAGTWCKHGC